MPSLIIEIIVRDPQLLGNGLSKKMELRGENVVPAASLKPLSAMITAELIDELKAARGQAKSNRGGQLELIPMDSQPHRPLNPIDDGFQLGESLNDAIAAFLKEDADRTELENTARDAIADLIAQLRLLLPVTAGTEMAMMHALDMLAATPPGEAIALNDRLQKLRLHAATDPAESAAVFLHESLGIVITEPPADDDAGDADATEDQPADPDAPADADPAGDADQLSDADLAIDATAIDPATGELLSAEDIDRLNKLKNKRRRPRKATEDQPADADDPDAPADADPAT